MKQDIETLKKTRAFLLEVVSGLSNEQLNLIPEGFSNNIIWNLGHLIAAHQGICYKRAGLPTIVDEVFFEAYKPGSRPEQHVSEHEVTAIKRFLLSTVDCFATDAAKGIFSGYTPWVTRYGVELKTIEDAMSFVHYHEGLHAGYIMALKRAVAQQEEPA